MSLLQNSNAISEVGGYAISNSLRFQYASTTYLSRTPASNGNRTTFTYSLWIKRGQFSGLTYNPIISSGAAAGAGDNITFENEKIRFWLSGAASGDLVTTQVFRDPSAWYHLVIAIDTTQATAANRIKMYVNGSQITAFSTATYPTQNFNLGFLNTTTSQVIGYGYNSQAYDGYMTEINFIDGQALTPSSFGETDTTTGQWVAKKYTGTYGTNGFYLPFSNGTSTTTLGADSSGNSNNWTLNNFTRSAGVSDCWMIDVPSGNGGASGTQPSSNYAVLNPLARGANTFSRANLTEVIAGSGFSGGSTIAFNSGKWYSEITYGANTTNNIIIGITDANSTAGLFGSGVGYYANDGTRYVNGGNAAYGSTYTTNDVIGIAVDMDAGIITFYKNNVSQGNITLPSTPANGWKFSASNGTSGGTQTLNANFGQRSFAYTPPTGFKALCTANLPAATIKKGNQFMDATLYTGNGAARSITNAGSFSPDLVWIKDRTIGYGHIWADTIRGATNLLASNDTSAEFTVSNSITTFNSNGFSLGDWVAVNTNTNNYVAWQWDAGSSTVTNTSGSISSQVRANPTAGVSVVTFTATGANSTVGHGLGVAPKMVITKSRNNTFVWYTWHTALAGNEYLELSTAVAKGTSAGLWNSTIPTSSVLSFGSSYPSGTNLVAYCFSEIAGFSKFGSYTGNGSADGTFVYLGFRPKFVMIKSTSGVASWVTFDSVRLGYNSTESYLSPNSSGVEGTISGFGIDILSNGFKLRATDATLNGSGSTYIYACFAENPFQNSNAR